MKARNPSTGNLETIYVKALDSMPVGTEVDFIGNVSDIPEGWQQVSEDITSLITKNSTNVGTEYTKSAYKIGSRCYFNAQFDINGQGTIYTLDNSIKPKYDEFAILLNYTSNNSEPGFAKINANSTNIIATIYESSISPYAILHIEWEV